MVRSPLSFPGLKGVRWRGLLVCAVDGTVLSVPDAPGALSRYTKQAGNHGGTGYPQLRLLALVACGTRAIKDAAFAPTTTGETTLFPALARSMSPGTLVLADRNFDARGVMGAARGAGADFLIRGKDRRRLPVLARHRDGSCTSVVAGMKVRVVDAEVAVTTDQGREAGGPDPDRGSFAVASGAARDLVVRAEAAVAAAQVGIVGQIGGRVPAPPPTARVPQDR
ncbi:MAG: transposase [Bifidobacteriaceae bacterium]|jgi:hypothetical protein|nr:transposase [Bifidobacteriaceae bacterium]